MYNLSEHNILVFLVQVFLLLGLARALGELFRFYKQPAITAEILAGLLLGPTIFGRFFPRFYRSVFPVDIIQENMLETVAWLGLLFFLLEIGLKMDFSSAWRHRGKALIIALTDICLPMLLAFAACYFLPARYLLDPNQKILFCLFMATAMTISAMPITIRVLNDLNVAKTDLGFLIMSALSVNEIIGWMILTLILGLFLNTNIIINHVIVLFLLAIFFTIFCLTYGRRLSSQVISKIRQRNMPEPASSLTFICLLGLLFGAIYQKIGIHALIGFFIAGIVAGEAKALPERTRQVISQMVYAIFVPLFFAGIGLRIDFLKHFDLYLAVFVTCVSICGKFLGAWLGAVFARLPKVNRMSVAIAHIPGGSMEIVIGLIALKYNLISEPMFVAIVVAAIISSVILGPWLKKAMCGRQAISILEFFSFREIVPELKSLDRDNAVRELCLVAHEQSNMPSQEALITAVLGRENTMTTAVEEGIALPHARIASLIRPMIVFGRAPSGIEWNSPDGKQSHLIFLILTPKEDDDIQVQILRIIARAMNESQIRERLIGADTRESLWEALKEAFTVHQVVRKKKK